MYIPATHLVCAMSQENVSVYQIWYANMPR